MIDVLYEQLSIFWWHFQVVEEPYMLKFDYLLFSHWIYVNTLHLIVVVGKMVPEQV